MRHWLQAVRTGVFQRYDHGKSKNLKEYGSKTPPPYDLDKMRNGMKNINTFLFRGDNDALVAEKDFENLKQQLRRDESDAILETTIIPEFGHLDYLWAANVNSQINQPIIDLMLSNY